MREDEAMRMSKIKDLSGNVVYENTANGGLATWTEEITAESEPAPAFTSSM